MHLTLARFEYGLTHTISTLTAERFTCVCLEDVVRPQGYKVPGQTAIPFGHYEIKMEYSPKFDMILPEFKNVPDFSEVKFHAGNTVEETEGCPLVGQSWAIQGGKASVQNSRITLKRLLFALSDSRHHTIAVENSHPGLEWHI